MPRSFRFVLSLGVDAAFLYSMPMMIGIAGILCDVDRTWRGLLLGHVPSVALLLIPAMVAGRLKGWYYSLIYVVSLPLAWITLGNILLYRVYPTADTFAPIVQSNFSESSEFILQYLDANVATAMAAITFIPLALLLLSCRFAVPIAGWGLKLALATSILVLHVLLPKGAHFPSPHWFVTSSYLCVAESLDDMFQMNGLLSEDVPACEATSSVEGRQTIVVVIGESLARNHMSLYSYPRKTNPMLERQKGLLVFDDVIAAHPATAPSLVKALTFMNHDSSEHSTSIVDLFNRSGFDTYWMSTQQSLGPFSTGVSLIAMKADEYAFLRQDDRAPRESLYGKYDEGLLVYLEEILNRPGEKKAVFLHLMGSHAYYECRYPDAYSSFSGQPPRIRNDVYDHAPRWKKGRMESIVNHYDNSVLYNDFVVGRILDMVRSAGGEDAMLLYFSDHGEELYEQDDFVGHSADRPTLSMFEIPFLMWGTPAALERLPVPVTGDTLHRPYQTDDLIHTLIDMAGIRTDLHEPEKSLLSPWFLVEARVMEGQDYDTLAARAREGVPGLISAAE